jgi:hypothetical protein
LIDIGLKETGKVRGKVEARLIAEDAAKREMVKEVRDDDGVAKRHSGLRRFLARFRRLRQ